MSLAYPLSKGKDNRTEENSVAVSTQHIWMCRTLKLREKCHRLVQCAYFCTLRSSRGNNVAPFPPVAGSALWSLCSLLSRVQCHCSWWHDPVNWRRVNASFSLSYTCIFHTYALLLFLTLQRSLTFWRVESPNLKAGRDCKRLSVLSQDEQRQLGVEFSSS